MSILKNLGSVIEITKLGIKHWIRLTCDIQLKIDDVMFLRNLANEILTQNRRDTALIYGLIVLQNGKQKIDDHAHLFFTEKACEAYIKEYAHNLYKPVSYGVWLWRNPEIERLIEIILKFSNTGESDET